MSDSIHPAAKQALQDIKTAFDRTGDFAGVVLDYPSKHPLYGDDVITIKTVHFLGEKKVKRDTVTWLRPEECTAGRIAEDLALHQAAKQRLIKETT